MNVFKSYYFNENEFILKNGRIKYIPKVVIYSKSALIQEMDRHRSSVKQCRQRPSTPAEISSHLRVKTTTYSFT